MLQPIEQSSKSLWKGRCRKSSLAPEVIAGFIEGFGQNCLCKQTLNKSVKQPKRNLKQRKIVLLAFGHEAISPNSSIDLSGNYKGLVHKLLPNADMIADRFHVIKIVNQA